MLSVGIRHWMLSVEIRHWMLSVEIRWIEQRLAVQGIKNGGNKTGEKQACDHCPRVDAMGRDQEHWTKFGVRRIKKNGGDKTGRAPYACAYEARKPGDNLLSPLRDYHRPWMLDGRVRNGNGYGHPGKVTGKSGGMCAKITENKSLVPKKRDNKGQSRCVQALGC